jgi:DNA-binding MarR family transcriptional regulator
MDATDNPDDALLDDASIALFRLGRVFSRQPDATRWREHGARPVELSRIMVVQAMEYRAVEDDEITVGTVAEQLGIDPSTASRLVADAVADGYVERIASARDARRASLALTPRGHDLARDARRYQRSVWDSLTRDWTPEERRIFARLFIRFAHTIGES